MRIRIILAAAAAPAALAAVVLGSTAGSASAAPNPGNGAVVITSQAQADALSGTTINKNVDVPAGVTRPDGSPIWLSWAHITGNLSIEGNVFLSADTVDGNVTVSGPGSFLGLSNYASHFERNLTVQNSSGIYTGGPGTTSFGNWTQYNAPSQVDGSFTFTGNTGPVLDRGGLNVDGQQNIS